ncbi:MAG: hypothetical protein PWQ06_382 [Anaerophaga sp.]|nr:hypothetical protein [Anaerophaga sp.]MDN5290143.1 hypothetical protein [Anaerophaga sp.]
MIKKIFFAILLTIATTHSKGQDYNFPSPSTTALGLSGASDSTAWAVFANPSGISNIRQPIAGTGYHNAFQIEALSTQTAFAVIPSSLMNTGIAYVRYGNQLFNIQQAGITAARALSNRLSLGCRMVYLWRYIKNTETSGTFLLDAGFRFRLSEAVSFAVSAKNPARQKISDEYNDQPLPSFLSAACITRLSPSFRLTADVMHRTDYSRQVYSVGMEARLHKMAEFCGAVSAKPVRLAIGVNINWKDLEIKVTANHHDHLGMSSTAGITYSFNGKKGGER